jgi:hypothetical protein
MNNYINQPPRKLFGLALIEYKSLKLTCEQKDFGRNTIGDASIACKENPCVLSLNKKTRENIYIIYSIFNLCKHHRDAALLKMISS